MICFKSGDDIFKVDRNRLRVYKNSEFLDLTRLELRLFFALSRELNRLVTKDKLRNEIWPARKSGDLTITVHRLRKKLQGGIYIDSEHGLGYSLRGYFLEKLNKVT